MNAPKPSPISCTMIEPGRYRLDRDYTYFSSRYSKFKTILAGTVSDGATGATDIISAAWWVHDELLVDGDWDDCSPVNRMQAAWVLADLLWEERRWFRAVVWWVATGPFWTLIRGNHLPT